MASHKPTTQSIIDCFPPTLFRKTTTLFCRSSVTVLTGRSKNNCTAKIILFSFDDVDPGGVKVVASTHHFLARAQHPDLSESDVKRRRDVRAIRLLYDDDVDRPRQRRGVDLVVQAFEVRQQLADDVHAGAGGAAWQRSVATTRRRPASRSRPVGPRTATWDIRTIHDAYVIIIICVKYEYVSK